MITHPLCTESLESQVVGCAPTVVLVIFRYNWVPLGNWGSVVVVSVCSMLISPDNVWLFVSNCGSVPDSIASNTNTVGVVTIAPVEMGTSKLTIPFPMVHVVHVPLVVNDPW